MRYSLCDLYRMKSAFKPGLRGTAWAAALVLSGLVLGTGACLAQGADSLLAQGNPAQAKKDRQKAIQAFRTLPLRFELNRGQTDRRVKLLARGVDYNLFLTGDGVTLVPPQTRGSQKRVLQMEWVGANADSEISGEDAFPGKSNYLIGNRPERWTTNVPVFGKA